jgi:hypothetical protein
MRLELRPTLPLATLAITFTLGCGLLVAPNAPAGAAEALPTLQTNQGYAEEAMRATTLAVDDPMAVFAFVLGNLPDRVKVYPTENYYYFSFIHHHIRYAGNIRLAASDRDEGKLHFVYYEDGTEWSPAEDATVNVVLDQAKGVTIEKVAPLAYRVSYGGKSVVFELNDLSAAKPPAGVLGPNEVYLGPIFDESAIRFFLVFNRKLKVFHFIRDETAEVADRLVAAQATDRILVGKRTGFAFYRDAKLDRKILIGAFDGNVRVNNYFDGPFDQLPDNFIVGETLRDAILAVEPELKDKVDRFGVFPDGARFLIGPYRRYRTADDLMVFHACATDKRVAAERYYECFVFDRQSGTVAARLRGRTTR